MTYRGHVKNGVVVLEQSDALADGTPVRVQPLKRTTRRNNGKKTAATLGQRLMRFAGTAKGLPKDMARNHDHYIRGARRK